MENRLWSEYDKAELLFNLEILRRSRIKCSLSNLSFNAVGDFILKSKIKAVVNFDAENLKHSVLMDIFQDH